MVNLGSNFVALISKTGDCLVRGTCPRFRMTLSRSGSAIFQKALFDFLCQLSILVNVSQLKMQPFFGPQTEGIEYLVKQPVVNGVDCGDHLANFTIVFDGINGLTQKAHRDFGLQKINSRIAFPQPFLNAAPFIPLPHHEQAVNQDLASKRQPCVESGLGLLVSRQSSHPVTFVLQQMSPLQ